MNDFQSPYIEGQVIGPEETRSNLRGFDTGQPLAVPEKIQGCSRSASDCLHKTKQLAHEFNHGTYCAAHLVLAMTLIPNATRQFELRKVDIDKAFRAAMCALMDMERGSPSHRNLPRPSEELSVIVKLAEDIAKNRDNQEVSVDDLLTAVDRMPAETSAAKLLRGERKNGQDLALRDSIEEFAAAIGRQLQELTQTVRMPPFESALLREFSDLRSYLQMREDNLERSIAAQFAELKTPPASPEPPPPQVPPASAESEKRGIWDTIVGTR